MFWVMLSCDGVDRTRTEGQHENMWFARLNAVLCITKWSTDAFFLYNPVDWMMIYDQGLPERRNCPSNGIKNDDKQCCTGRTILVSPLFIIMHTSVVMCVHCHMTRDTVNTSFSATISAHSMVWNITFFTFLPFLLSLFEHDNRGEVISNLRGVTL